MSAPFRLRPYEASEFEDQRALVRALNAFAPIDLHFHHTPNQSSEGPARGKFLKDLGRRAGVADLYFLRDGRTLFLEMKTRKGLQSESQKEFQRSITRAGGMYEISRSLDEAHAILFEFGFMDRKLLGSA